MSRTEFADGRHHAGYPSAWGRPPGDSDSEIRAAWVRLRVRESINDAPGRDAARRAQRLLELRQRAA